MNAPNQTDPGAGRKGLIERLISACAHNPVLTVLTVAAAAMWGWYSMRHVALDAIPDLSDVQVIVQTEWPGRSPDLVEDQVTYPVTSALLSAPGVRVVRGQSFMGLSLVYVIFEDGTDMYWARSRVLEYLNTAQARLPADALPSLGPDATGVGWVFQYALVDTSGRHDLAELRSFQDWTLRPWLESIDGVAEIASVGGFVKQYQVHLDPNRLLAYGIPLAKVVSAIRRSNQDVGGRVVEIAEHEHFIRGRGYITSLADLEAVPLKVGDDGVPVTVGDVGVVQFGPEMRRGLAELNGEGETVGGIVVMRYGENALRTIDNVKQRIKEVRASLPEGMQLVVTYDRSELIRHSIRTLRTTLIEEMVIVSIVIAIFLMHARSALVPVIVLPLAVLISFIPIFYQGLTANIMSLGGIAVAIGAMVDAAIVIIENIHKKLADWKSRDGTAGRTDVIIGAMQEVGPSIFFSLLVITVAFLPVFTLEATEGRLFKPLAFTKTYSMGFAALLAVTLTPALAVLLIRGRVRNREQSGFNRWLIRVYEPVVRWSVRRRRLVIVIVLVALAGTAPLFLRMEREFMPPLNEGSILYMPTAVHGISITEAGAILQAMNRELRKFPEVQTVFGKMGRADTATDPAPLSMAETVILLKPRSEWRPGLTWESLINEMDQRLQIPGMPNNWWMPIQTRTQMLATGIRSALGIKVFGPTLEQIEKTAVQIEQALLDDERTRPHTRSAFAERIGGGYFIDVNVDRAKAARHGLTVADVEEVIMTAIGGMNVTQTIEGRERYWVNVRYARDFRDNPDELARVLVATPGGAQVPISEVADIRFETGPPMIRNEDGQLLGFVFVDVTGIGIADYVEIARSVVEERVDLRGTRLDWAGQFKYLERATAQLKTVVPVTLLIILVLLYVNTRSMTETMIVLLAIPFSVIGATWFMTLLQYKMSVAVWVGMIALAGLAAEIGVIMLLYLRLAFETRLRDRKLRTPQDLEDAIVEGSAGRIRPILMTVLTTFLGLMPVMWGAGAGSDVMKRIAAPMVGGLVSVFLFSLTVYPAVFAFWKTRRLAGKQAG